MRAASTDEKCCQPAQNTLIQVLCLSLGEEGRGGRWADACPNNHATELLRGGSARDIRKVRFSFSQAYIFVNVDGAIVREKAPCSERQVHASITDNKRGRRVPMYIGHARLVGRTVPLRPAVIPRVDTAGICLNYLSRRWRSIEVQQS